MNETLFSINGRIVPEAHAVVPVTDRGFLYGDGVFETIHAYGPRLFRLEAHLERLRPGAAALHFHPAPDIAVITEWLDAAIAAGRFPESNVRLTVTRGTGPRGPS